MEIKDILMEMLEKSMEGLMLGRSPNALDTRLRMISDGDRSWETSAAASFLCSRFIDYSPNPGSR